MTRVRAVCFQVKPHPGGVRDEATGLIRSPTGEVLTIDDNVTVPPGTLGTVIGVDGVGTVFVKWDNGVHLGLVDGDEWEEVDGET